jgi:lipoate-protein ligase B
LPSTSAPLSLPWAWLGRVPFDHTAALQERLRESILGGASDRETLLLCEHEPVITLGKRARPEHLLLPTAEFARRGIELRSASRGGEATYHGPGQLVAYPVMRLRRGVLAHVEGMARAVIDLLAPFGVQGVWNRAEPGVWVDGAKICAFGVHVRRGVAVHGLALNVRLPLDAFSTIVPCGKPQGRVTSLDRHIADAGAAPAPEALAGRLAFVLGCAFGLEFRAVSPESVERVHDCKNQIVTDMMERA